MQSSYYGITSVFFASLFQYRCHAKRRKLNINGPSQVQEICLITFITNTSVATFCDAKK